MFAVRMGNRYVGVLYILFSFLLSITSSSFAEQTIVNPCPAPIDPESLESTFLRAHITNYDAEKDIITLDLVCCERFSRDDILNLKAGDIIRTAGYEFEVGEIIEEPDEDTGPWFHIREKKDDTDDDVLWLWMYPTANGDYCHLQQEETVMVPFYTIQIELGHEDPMFIDYNAVRNLDELRSMLCEEGIFEKPDDQFHDPWSRNLPFSNLRIAFDESGKLAMIWRSSY